MQTAVSPKNPRNLWLKNVQGWWGNGRCQTRQVCGAAGRRATAQQGFAFPEDHARAGLVDADEPATKEWRYYQRDGNSLVRQTTNGQEDITLAWTFSPEGAVVLGEEGPVTNLDCGSNATYDWSTGLIFKNGRYFDPNTGIWLAMGGVFVWQANWQRRSSRYGKRKRRLFLILLFTFIVLSLAGCGGQNPDSASTPTPTCTPTSIPGLPPSTPIPSPVPTPTLDPTPGPDEGRVHSILNGYVVFVDKETASQITPADKRPVYEWPSRQMEDVSNAFQRFVQETYAGPRGFGSIDSWAAASNISKRNPVRLAFTSESRVSAWWSSNTPWGRIPIIYYGLSSRPTKEQVIHELAHILDNSSGFHSLSSPMKIAMNVQIASDGSGIADIDNHGNFPTEYAQRADDGYSEAEDFAESITSYFFESYASNQDWSDDHALSAYQPDSQWHNDRYDYVESVFGK